MSNTTSQDPESSAILYQEMYPLRLEVRLQNLEEKLRSIPLSKRAERRVTQLIIDRLKEKIRIQDEAEAALEAREEREATSLMMELTEEYLADIQSPEIPPEPSVIVRKTAAPTQEVYSGIKNTDQKAMFFLAASVAILAFLITHNAPTGWFSGPDGWLFKDYVSFASVVGLTTSAVMMLKVLSATHKQDARVTDKDLLRGCLIGAVSALLGLLFLILSKRPHPIHVQRYY